MPQSNLQNKSSIEMDLPPRRYINQQSGGAKP